MNKVEKLVRDISSDPATAIALGSAFMAAAQGGIEGAYLNLVTAFGIGCVRGYESWTGKEKGLNFGALSAVNFTTAGSIGYHALQNHGLTSEIAPQALMTGLYFFSGIRSALLAWHQNRQTKPTGFQNDPQFYQGIACLGATRPDRVIAAPISNWQDIIPIGLSSLGIIRTFIKDDKNQSFLMQHYTAARAYAAQYGFSALTAATPEQAAGFLLWAWGFSRFDKKLNKDLWLKTQRTLGREPL